MLFTIDDLRLDDVLTPLAMQWVNPGTFMMGSPETDKSRSPSERPFQATLTKGFWLGRVPVTQNQWQAVMGNNPSHFQPNAGNHPVEQVNWQDALDFCNCLNARYADLLPAGYHFSLPTEVQWEYACRAGTHGIYYNGKSPADYDRIAWHKDNSGGRTHPVGQKEPNAWGFCDMLGQVMEWCFDRFSKYPAGSGVDWIGTDDTHDVVSRSAAWGTALGGSSRIADRGYVDPKARRPWFGFRLCLRSTPPSPDGYERPN